MFLHQRSCQCPGLRVLIYVILGFEVMALIFNSEMGIQSLYKMSSQKILHNAHTVESIENMLKENLELRKLLADLNNDKINEQSDLKQTKDYEIQHGNESSVNAEERITPEKPFSKTVGNVSCAPREPSVEYETMRRRIRFNTLEMWSYLSNELMNFKEQIKVKIPELVEEINEVILLGAEHKRSLIADIDKLHLLDGYEEWRQKEIRELSDLVQRRLNYIQNPIDCKSARRLLCSLKVHCGLGCFLHHVADCFIKSYAEERTMIFINSTQWAYNRDGWEKIFKPVSNTCLVSAPVNGSTNYTNPKNHVIYLPRQAPYKMPPPYFPKALPEDLALRLTRLDDEPSALWVGYFLKYMMRQQPLTREILKSGIEKIGWKKPIVGVHVRRTDKIIEAKLHSIEEYMVHVEDYYLTLELNGTKQERRIYISTDEPRVLAEARTKYPQYEILCNPDAARLAALDTRFSPDSLYGVLLDVHLLSNSDFVVGALSSTICRIVYEIMQTMYLDPMHHFKSIDYIYFYSAQLSNKRRAIIEHKQRKEGEIDLEIGDVVNLEHVCWNGYCEGTNLRSLKKGKFPTFKTLEVHRSFKFPTYTKV